MRGKRLTLIAMMLQETLELEKPACHHSVIAAQSMVNKLGANTEPAN